MIDEIGWSFMLQNPVLAAMIVIAYFQWSIKHGTLSDHFDTVEGLVSVTTILAEEVEGVDEDAVRERFNGDFPADYEQVIEHGSKD